jgi:hypothetical protein
MSEAPMRLPLPKRRFWKAWPSIAIIPGEMRKAGAKARLRRAHHLFATVTRDGGHARPSALPAPGLRCALFQFRGRLDPRPARDKRNYINAKMLAAVSMVIGRESGRSSTPRPVEERQPSLECGIARSSRAMTSARITTIACGQRRSLKPVHDQSAPDPYIATGHAESESPCASSAFPSPCRSCAP